MGRISDEWEKFVRKFFKRDDAILDYSTMSEKWKENPIIECNSIPMFTFNELAKVAKGLEKDCDSGVTDLGKVYKGRLNITNKQVNVVMICQYTYRKVDEEGNREFLAQVSRFRLLDHVNIATVVGYCCETYGSHRLLVYDSMALRSLKNKLHGPHKKALNWNTRMKIAQGVAKGLEYLHNKTDPPVLCQYLNTSTTLLDKDFHPKQFLSGSRMILENVGYFAPDFSRGEPFTSKSDVYSFGIVLLEIITGRKIYKEERRVIQWARTQFSDRSKLEEMADPMLLGQYPPKGLVQALSLVESCLHEKPKARPRIEEIVTIMNSIVSQK